MDRFRQGGHMPLVDTFMRQVKHIGQAAGDKYADSGRTDHRHSWRRTGHCHYNRDQSFLE